MGDIKKPIQSRKDLYSKRKEWRAIGTSERGGYKNILLGAAPVFLLAFVVAFLAASIITPTRPSDASTTNLTTTQVTRNANNYYIRLWADSDVNLDLTSGSSAPMTVAETTVKAFTNSPSGYKLYLGTTSSNTSLILENETNAISSIGVTPDNATALTANTWGFAVNGTNPGSPAPWYGTTRTTGVSMSANEETFAGVPAYGSEGNALLSTTTRANGTGGTAEEDEAQADNVGVYYAVRANSSLPSGRYSNTVAYTALAEASSTGDFEADFSPAYYVRPTRMEAMGTIGTSTGQTLTINTSIYTTATADIGTASVTLQGGPLSTGHGEDDVQQTYICSNPNVAVVDDLVQVTCTLPIAYAGKYNLKVHLDRFNADFETPYYYYVTWQTVSAMQEMSYAPPTVDVYKLNQAGTDYELTSLETKGSVCATATDPTNKTHVTSNPVADTPFYRPVDVAGHATGARTDNLNSSTTAALWTPSTTVAANSVPEIFLKDVRDYVFYTEAKPEETSDGEIGGGYIQAEYYRIRKLADGNCWMTENMDHPQQKDHYYFAWDTDLNSKTKWAPTDDFIDGTLAGTNISHVDAAYDHDHTYYGNGCSNSWGTSGEGGSIYSCPATDDGTTPGHDGAAGGRIVKTYDNEEQKNGTYYHYEAASVGEGSKISTNNANVPDTFCPTGWQLPYSGTGGSYYNASKSWSYLFTTYGYGDNESGNENARSYPLSYVYSGTYYWSTGRLYVQTVSGTYWPSSDYTSTNSYRLRMYNTRLIKADTYNKRYGGALRCIPKLAC